MRLVDIVSAPWAITPEMFEEVQGIYARHCRGEKLDLSVVEARLGRPLENARRDMLVEDGVAVISLEGVLAKRANLFMQISGGTSMQIAANQVRAAADDPEVRAIVLAIDSPGGTVDGTQELADAVYAAREKKTVLALADGQMASAAYWIGSAAEKIYISSETTAVGSIGVVATHVDASLAEAQRGIRTTEITAGKYKRIDSAYGPLSAEGRAYLQERVDAMYEIFVEAVARNRGVSAETVVQNMADGRVFIGRQAIAAGLVDGVSTLDRVIAKARSGGSPPAGARVTALDGVSQTVAHQEVDPMTITVESLKKDHPDVAKALFDEGHAAGVTEGREAGIVEGADRERARIRAVEEQLMPGCEALIAEMKFDGKTSGEQAAVRVLKAQREKTSRRLEDLKADAAEASSAAAAAPQPGGDRPEDSKALAARAQELVESERKAGRRISVAAAVARLSPR